MDQNNPNQPAQAPTPPTNAQVVTFVDSTKAAIKELWLKYSIFFIIVGVVILVAKFGNIMIDLLSYFSKKDLEKAQQQDAQLKKQEDTANQQANQLVDKANSLPSQEPPVSDEWYKNGKK